MKRSWRVSTAGAANSTPTMRSSTRQLAALPAIEIGPVFRLQLCTARASMLQRLRDAGDRSRVDAEP